MAPSTRQIIDAVQAALAAMLMCYHANDREHRDGLEGDYAVARGVSQAS